VGAVENFIAHPRTFLRENVLIVICQPGGTDGIKNCRLQPSGGSTGRNMLKNGAPMPVFSLLVDVRDNPNCQVWWCPYEDNNRRGTVLPGQGGPNAMFTYGMDGCTLVAGSVASDQTVRVHHINMRNAAKALPGLEFADIRFDQQRRIQRGIANAIVANPKILDPEDYYDPSKAAVPIPPNAKIATVTFGRRGSREGWKFYTHQYYPQPGDGTTKCFIGMRRVI
jgi:hypothetical protein